MRVLIAFDKFKDALTAPQACEAAARGLHVKYPDWQLDLCPLTDGGEGFCETLVQTARGRLQTTACSGPRGALIKAVLGQVDAGNLCKSVLTRLRLEKGSSLAVLEMAATSGLGLLSTELRDPWQTSSYGTGEQLHAATRAGSGAILLGVGGSATNDLGLGALAALGFRFIDRSGATVTRPTPVTWETIVQIDPRGAMQLPPVFIACDVTNPLLGPTGATVTFGPQKGLRSAEIPRLEKEMARMAGLLGEACGKPPSLANTPGAGAAGGIAFGLMTAYGTELTAGFDLVSDWLGLPARVVAADLVLTGEGRFDLTSLGGKGPGSLVAAARRAGKAAHIFAGCLDLPANHPGLDGIATHAITPATLSLTDALPRTAELLTEAVAGIF